MADACRLGAYCTGRSCPRSRRRSVPHVEIPLHGRHSLVSGAHVRSQLRREMAAGINGRSSAVDNVGFAIGLARLLPEALGKRLALAWRAPSRYRAPEPGQQFLAPRAAKTRVRRRGMNRKRLIRETLAKIAIAAAGDGQRESLAHAQVVDLRRHPRPSSTVIWYRDLVLRGSHGCPGEGGPGAAIGGGRLGYVRKGAHALGCRRCRPSHS